MIYSNEIYYNLHLLFIFYGSWSSSMGLLHFPTLFYCCPIEIVCRHNYQRQCTSFDSDSIIRHSLRYRDLKVEFQEQLFISLLGRYWIYGFNHKLSLRLVLWISEDYAEPCWLRHRGESSQEPGFSIELFHHFS